MGVRHREHEAGDDDLAAGLEDLEGEVGGVEPGPQRGPFGPGGPQLGLALGGLLEDPTEAGGHVEAPGQERLGPFLVRLHDRAHDGAALLDLVGIAAVGGLHRAVVAGDIGPDRPLDHPLSSGDGQAGHLALAPGQVVTEHGEGVDVGLEPIDAGPQGVQFGPHRVATGLGLLAADPEDLVDVRGVGGLDLDDVVVGHGGGATLVTGVAHIDPGGDGARRRGRRGRARR